MGTKLILRATVSFIIGSCLSVVVILRNIYVFILGPKQFFWKTREKPPACLNDPGLGSHNFVHLENVRLHYVCAGDENKPLMLMLHGFPEFWYSWRHQIREFKKDYRVVAVDQRGYPGSDAPAGVSNYHTGVLAKDVQQLVRALGHKSCVLVGHDWGGVVAWTVAGLYPEIVDKLIIMNCPHPLSFAKHLQENPSQMLKSWYILFFCVPFLPELNCCVRDREALDTAFTSQRCGVRNTKLTEEDIEAYKFNFPTLGSFTGPINYYRSTWRNAPPRLRNVSSPTLLIWGCQDAFLERGMAPRSEKYVESKLTIKYVEEASHWVQMDTPEVVNSLMREFLQ